MSVCDRRLAPRARARYTATASQGLLFMAEAVYNASGLGLPIVMTVANRAIGAPINIWNDHTDAMSQRDSGWIQLYAESNQEALDLHIQAFRLAEELSLPVMVCMDGFVLTHAYERVDMPTQEQVDAFLPAVRAAPGARPRRPDDDRRDGRPRGVHRGALPDARQADAGARRDPADRGGVRGGVRPRVGRASCAATASRTPRRSSSRSARCSARSRTSSTSCATPARPSARWPSAASGRGRLEEVRAALAGAGAVVVVEKALRGRRRRDRRPERAPRARGPAGRRPRRRRRARRARDHDGLAARAARRRARRAARAHDLPRPRLELVERELARGRDASRAGPHAENMLRDMGIVAHRAT